ncbi:MAG: extracellular solute-binding protein [Treponema sp.]|jgi:putative aldouronate transport system substrate-binding protein|nr:extracellular solute-binding protein [Treponema sp.]
MRKSLLFPAVLALLVYTGCADKSGSAEGGVVSIKVEVFDRGTDGGKTSPANNEWTKWIHDKVLKDENIDVTFVPVPRWTEEADIVSRMAAQDAPDLCYTYSMDNVRNWGKLGGVYDLTPYVDTLLKDMQEIMGEDPAIPGQNLIWHSRDADTGALYGISNKYIYTSSHNTFIRQDWLDALDLPLPRTTEEFYRTMAAFKENAGKLLGGQAVRMTPFLITADIRWQVYNILLSFMPPDISAKDRWINTIAERQLLIPGVKDAYRWLNKLYNEGLIDPDFPLYNDDTEPGNKMKSGVVGAFQHNWDQPYRQNTQIQTELQKNIPGAKFVPVDCFTNLAGMTPKRGTPQAGGLIFFVPKAAGEKKLEAALRYANWLCRYENYHFLQFGHEGINHKVVDGVEIPIPASGPWIQNSGVNVDYTMSINGYVVDDENFGLVLSSSYPGIPAEDITAAYKMSSFNTVPDAFRPITIDSIAEVRQEIVAKEKELSVNVIRVKTADFDRLWDDGIKDWLASGAQRVLDEQRVKYR